MQALSPANTISANSARDMFVLADYDPPQDQLDKLKHELHRYNTLKTMVTYSRTEVGWTDWERYAFVGFSFCFDLIAFRPYRLTNSGQKTYVAPSGYCRIPDLPPILCGHAENPLREDKECTMTLHSAKAPAGGIVHYYQVPSRFHTCPFIGESISFFNSYPSVSNPPVFIPNVNEPTMKHEDGIKRERASPSLRGC